MTDDRERRSSVALSCCSLPRVSADGSRVHERLRSEGEAASRASWVDPESGSGSGSVSEEASQDASDQFRVAVRVGRGCWWPGEQLAEPRVLA